MRDEFGLEKSAMLNDPRSSYWPYIILKMDGDAMCAHLNSFTNLQESPAGFGDTRKEAISALLIGLGFKCRKAMWTGFGAPAGVCGEAAFGGEVHPNTLSMFLCRDLAQCPKHGGFDLAGAAALASYYRVLEDKSVLRDGEEG